MVKYLKTSAYWYLRARRALILLLLVAGCSRTATTTGPLQASTEQLQLRAIMLASVNNPETIPAFQPRNARPANEVAPGNLLKIECAEDEKISGEFRVAFDGSINLPYNITLTVGGESIERVKELLQQQYSKFFRGVPRFDVSKVDGKLMVRAQGLVEKPGEYLLSEKGSIDSLIAEAGGLQRSADQKPLARYARIAQDSYRAAVNLADYYSGAQSAGPVWHGGETVFFQNEGQGIADLISGNKSYVQILGQVRNPGEYQVKDSANFFDYLVQAGGPTDRANMSNIVVVRPKGSKLDAIPFSLEDTASIPPIKGGDIVLVQADNPSSLERETSIFGNIGGFLSALAATVLVAAGI